MNTRVLGTSMNRKAFEGLLRMEELLMGKFELWIEKLLRDYYK